MGGLIWGLLSSLALTVLALLGAMISKQGVDEFKAWTPWIVNHLIDSAVRRLPADDQERYAEEWRSHVREIPGEVGKLLEAFGYLTAAHKMLGAVSATHWNRWFYAKPVTDKILATFILCLTAPIILIMVLAIRIESRGPALFRSDRIGFRGRHFGLFKFRTQFIDQGGRIRPTRVGRILRTLRLDELPQLFNVLRGDMSFVGPRPVVPTKPTTQLRQMMRPGLTGWAQINDPDGMIPQESQEKLAHDLFYLHNAGFIFDLFIILRTINIILTEEQDDAEE